MARVEVDPGDPHNDQMLEQTKEDLNRHMKIVREVLDQAEEQDAPLSACIAVLASHWIREEEIMPRERLASLLALALIQAHANQLIEEDKEFADFIRRITSK